MARGWSAARLAREINLDPSYIRRWIKGDRVPSVKSDYVEQIAECLCRGTDSQGMASHMRVYAIALNELGFHNESSKPVKEAVKDALMESQIFSLKFSPKERILKSATTEDDIVSLLGRIGKEKRNAGGYDGDFNTPGGIGAVPAIVKGREAILHAYIALIKAARECRNLRKGKIILTFQSESHPFDGYPKLEEYWRSNLCAALEEGWEADHILRLNKDITRSMKLVKRIVQTVGLDNHYHPYYFEKYGTLSPAYDVIIVEGIGALVSFSTEDADYVDTAFFYNADEAVKSLERYYMQIFGSLKPLLGVYTLDEYFVFNTEADRKPGDRFIIRNDLDSMSMPYSLWVKYLSRVFKDDNEAEPHLRRIKTRLDSFLQQVERYKFMNICSTQAIENLINSREYLYDNVYRVPMPEEIIEHLENIVHLLKTYENYEIGLLTENQMNLLPPAFWEIKGDYSVIIDMWYPREGRGSAAEPGLFLAITEATIAGSFREHFLDIWEKISPRYRDREYVIKWFEEKLQLLYLLN
jgi:transcriptional regulator with XRE-family HTH domain